MNYLAGLLGGVASNLIFWFLQTSVLELQRRDAIIVAVACFVIFGFLGYWLTSKSPPAAVNGGGVSIGTGISSRKDVTVDAGRVAGAGGTPTRIGTNIDADGNVRVNAKDIQG